MIHLTRLHHSALVVNSDLIEHIEATPDTVLSLTTGQKITVLETADEVVNRIVSLPAPHSGTVHLPARKASDSTIAAAGLARSRS